MKNSGGIGIPDGLVMYGGSKYKLIGQTDAGGIVQKELLPVSYSFRMQYEGGTQQIDQNIGSNATVTFKTVKVTVSLKNSSGIGIAGGTVTYAGSKFNLIGQTGAGGIVQKELLPVSYYFRMQYAGIIQQISQNVGANPFVKFIQ